MANLTIPAAPAEGSPDVSPCGCEWAAEPWHDDLAGVEHLEPVRAVMVWGELAMGEGLGFFEPGDFLRFVAAHNWDDPVFLAQEASRYDQLAEAWLAACRKAVPATL